MERLKAATTFLKSRVIPSRPLRGEIFFLRCKLKMVFVRGKMVQAGDHTQAIPCLPAGEPGGNTALTLQVVLKAQLGSMPPTLLTEGVRALD